MAGMWTGVIWLEIGTLLVYVEHVTNIPVP
jgi:hypothetical protein